MSLGVWTLLPLTLLLFQGLLVNKNTKNWAKWDQSVSFIKGKVGLEISGWIWGQKWGFLLLLSELETIGQEGLKAINPPLFTPGKWKGSSLPLAETRKKGMYTLHRVLLLPLLTNVLTPWHTPSNKIHKHGILDEILKALLILNYFPILYF